MKWDILCYHTVDHERADIFARQLRWFRDQAGYDFRPFQQAFMERRQGGREKWITVSFDDGDWTVGAVAKRSLTMKASARSCI